MPIEYRPVRMPRRKLTASQAEKFAALREEIEMELASRAAARAHLLRHQERARRRWRSR